MKILYQKEGPIAWLRLNDPERLNALNEEMGEQLRKIVVQIQKDRSIRVVILTGEGRAFSAGGNLEMLAAWSKEDKKKNEKRMFRFYKNLLSLLDLPQPVIAMINGHAIGAGFLITLACDIRLAAAEAKMGVNFVKLGLGPGVAATYLMPKLLGLPQAIEILFTGRIFSADEAKERGMVSQVVPSAHLEETTRTLAQEIAENSPIALRMIKKGITNWKDLNAALRSEAKAQAVSFHSEDLKEGIQAFREKRKPNF